MTETQWLSCDDPHALLKALAEGPRSWRAKVAACLGMRHHGASDRKARLFAVACCSRIWHLLVDPRSRTAVEVCEQFVDGRATRSQLKDAIAAASAVAAKGIHPATSSLMAIAQAYAAEAVLAAVASPEQSHTAAVRARDALRALNIYNSPDSAKLRILPTSFKGRSSRVDYGQAESQAPVHAGAAAQADAGEVAWTAERRAQADLVRDIFGNPFQSVAIPRSCFVPSVLSVARAIYDQRSFERMPELGKALEDAGCTVPQVVAHCCSGREHVRGCWVIDALLGKN